jgi:hypothetical protein
MKRVFVTSIIGFILFSLPVFAASVHQYNVYGEIFNNYTVHYEIDFLFVNHGDQNFSLLLISPENIHINTPTDCTIEKRALGTELSCFIPSSKQTMINIEYNSDQSLEDKGNYNLFSDSYRIFMDTKTLSIIVKLPEGSGLKEPIENSYSPADALKGSDGRKLFVNWLKNDLKQGERFDVSIAFESFNGIVPSSFPVEGAIATVIIIIVSSIFFYRIYWSKRYLKLVIPILKEDEKIIFKTLMKHGNGVKQKIIVRDSGYSKAKVSKVLNSLRERGILKLERTGRTNKVYIDKKFQKKA